MSLLQKENLNWRTLFDSLINDHKIHYDLQVKDDMIKLIADKNLALAIESKLLEMLSDEGFSKNLPYVLNQSVSSVKQANNKIIIELPTYDVSSAKDLLLRLFGEDAFDCFAIDINKLFDQTAVAKDGVLFSKITKHQRVQESWNMALKHWIAFFKNVPIDRIREAWLNPDKPLPPPPDDLNETQSEEFGLVNGLIQQCFGTLTNETNTQAQIFFNFGRLWQFISVPDIKQQLINDDKIELSLDKNHLLACLQALTKNRVLFRVYQSQNNLEDYIAKAIFFGREPTVSKQMFHTLIIDRSGSMEEYFRDLKIHLLEVIKNLGELDKTAKLRLVFFSTHMKVKEFNITHYQEIKSYLEGISSDGDTRLFGTIADELSHLLKNGITKHYNSTVLLFTDGHDTVANSSFEKFPEVQQKIQGFTTSKSVMPKMFAVGFGNCDHKTLQELARLMGNTYIHLKEISDFDNVFSHIRMHKSQREMIEFLITVQEMTHRYTVPFYHMNSVQVPDVIIPIGKNRPLSVTLSGNDLVVTLKEDQVPIATTNDHLAELLINARQLIADESVQIDLAITKLNDLLTQASKIKLHPEDKNICDYVQEQIKFYIDQLKVNRFDKHAQASLISLIRSQQGFFSNSNEADSQKLHVQNPDSHTLANAPLNI
jgi:von Willebrand factor type A domain